MGQNPCIADGMLLNDVIRMLAAGAGSEIRRCARRTVSPWELADVVGFIWVWLAGDYNRVCNRSRH
jgi:hypothetical protein